MSTVSVKEKGEGREAPRESGGDSYVKVFIVIQDDINDGPKAARVAEDPTDFLKIPERGDEFPEDPAARVISIIPVATASRLIWEVIVSYVPRSFQSSDISDPTELDDIVSIKFNNNKVIVVKDLDTGDPIENSAGDPLIAEENEQAQSITIKRNLSLEDFSLAISETYTGTINLTQVTIKGKVVAPFGAKISWTGTQQQAQGIKFWATIFSIDFAPKSKTNGWQREFLDAGFKYLDGTDPKKIFLKDGSEPKDPQKLNGAGAVLIPPAAAVYLEFQTLTSIEWSPLNLNRQDTNQ